MPIDANNINKYIFNPQNPQQCKSYNLLLKIAQKDNVSFFSSEFLQYFFGNEIINDRFKNELWDIPLGYDDLSISEKISLYIEQFSESDLEDFKKSINEKDIKINKISKYYFFKKVSVFEYGAFSFGRISYIKSDDLINYIKQEIFDNDDKFSSVINYSDRNYNDNFIMFSKDFFNILNLNILKASIFITLEENIDKFLEYKHNQNIKPIFLKKIEDVNLLLNILENDIKKSNCREYTKEKIQTIDSFEIENFFSIKKLKLENLKDKKEIYIVGENGDGKTLLLQALVIALKGSQEDGQGKFREISKEYNLKLIDSASNTYKADESNRYENIFAYGANRNSNCQKKEDESGYLTLFDNSLDLYDPISWLITLDHSESRGDKNVISVGQAKELLRTLLNSDIKIDITPNIVTFEEKGSAVDFQQLSAGYKGVITIICDMLVRLSANQPYVTDIHDFQGIVIIDEVELHLHPKWKYDFMNKIRELFPLMQFIVTTHSPTVILGASKEAIFYKIYKEDGEVCISDQILNRGYTNNTLISSPLFDLDTMTSRNYDNKKLSEDDYIYEKIHEVVAKKIEEDINLSEEEILKLISDELDKA